MSANYFRKKYFEHWKYRFSKKDIVHILSVVASISKSDDFDCSAFGGCSTEFVMAIKQELRFRRKKLLNCILKNKNFVNY